MKKKHVSKKGSSTPTAESTAGKTGGGGEPEVTSRAATIMSSMIMVADGTSGQSVSKGRGIKRAHIQDDAITEEKLKNKAVSSAKIKKADGTTGQDISQGYGIKTQHIQDRAVTPAKIEDIAVKTRHIEDYAVSREKIADSAVNDDKLSNDAVASFHLKIADGTSGQKTDMGRGIKTDHIQDDAITSPKILNLSVTKPKIANDAVVEKKIKDAAVASPKIKEADGSTGQDITRGYGIKTSHIQDDAITSAKIRPADCVRKKADGSVDQDITQGSGIKTDHIQDDAVTTAKIESAAVETEILADHSVTSVKLALADTELDDYGNFDQDTETGEGVKTGHIKNEAVTEPKIKDDSVSSAKIREADGTTEQDTTQGYGIKTPHIQNLAVTNDKIAEGTINENRFDPTTKEKLVTGGDSHDHLGGDGAQIKHSSLELEDGVNVHGIGMSDLVDHNANGNINANTNKIVGLAAPTDTNDAVNKEYVDGKEVDIKGYADANDAVIKAYVDSHVNEVTSGKLVTNGDSHDHSGGDGGTIKHSSLDLELVDKRNPHGVTAEEVGAVPIENGIISRNLQVNGNVGIGKQSLGSKLDVAGDIAINGTSIITDTGQWIGSPTGLKGDKGDKGGTGAQGIQGPQGPQGTSSWTDGDGIVRTEANVYIGSAIASARKAGGPISPIGVVGAGAGIPICEANLDVNGEINVNSHKIVGLANPESSQDAATKFYVNSRETEIKGIIGSIIQDESGNPLKIVCGKTSETETDWKKFDLNIVYVDVTIPSFKDIPLYFFNIHVSDAENTNGYHPVSWMSSAHDRTRSSFRVYASNATPEQAKIWGWHVEWIAIGGR